MNVGQFTLREHQIRAIEQARAEVVRLKGLGLPPRVLVIAPCGAGKTVMSSALISGARDKGKTSVFMASGRTLIYQKSRTLDKAGISHAVLMAGEEERWWQSAVLVASKDTYTSRALHSSRIGKERRDLWIVDEAHRAMSGEWMAVLPQDNETVVIGFTATPALNNGKGLEGYYKGLVKATTYEELISQKMLTPCRVFAPWAVDTRGLTKHDGDWSWSQVAERAKKLVGRVVETWQKLGENRPTVCFAQGVEHSIGLCHEFNNAGIPAAHIDANTPEDERQEAYRGLRDGRLKVVTNFGVLTTGWDEPCVSCGILAFATDSLVKLLQTAGRVLRTYPGKEDAILIDHGDNIRRHGWPTDDHDWSLDTEQTITERDIKARDGKNQREPICCPHCGAMRESGPKCINCGHQHKKSGIKVVNEDGELIELKPKKTKDERKVDDLHRLWMQCLAIAARKRGNACMAKVLFAIKAKQSANSMKPMPEPHQMTMPIGMLWPGFLKRKKVQK